MVPLLADVVVKTPPNATHGNQPLSHREVWPQSLSVNAAASDERRSFRPDLGQDWFRFHRNVR